MHDSANTQRRSINRLVQGGRVGRVAECSFPMRPLGETVTQYSCSERDAFSHSALCGKLRPTLKGKTGSQFPNRASKQSCGGIVPAWGFNQQKQEPFHRKLLKSWDVPPSYRWRSRKRKAKRIQGRTATCLSSLSTAVLALPSERPWPPWSKTCISHATPSSAMRCANG